MQKLLVLLVLLLSFHSSFATINGTVADKNGDSLEGVNIHWLGTSQGVVSNHDGTFRIDASKNSNRLIFSYVSFSSDTITIVGNDSTLHVVLSETQALDEINVISKQAGTVKSRTSAIQTEKITGAELCKAACCNLSESFVTNASVDVSYADAATGAKQIKLLGLTGMYVQMLTENIPNLRGISSAYGLGYIPGPWMESIQVSKGTSSVVNGYEAIAGQINVEYKKPQTSEKLAVNVFASDEGRLESNVNASAILSPYLSTGILLHASKDYLQLDDNGDGFMDMPMVNQLNFINRWYYKRDDFVSQAFVRALSENRMGGQLNGNYHIGIDTKRYEFFVKNGYIFDEAKGNSIGLIVSGSLHQQDAHYGMKHYDGHQGNLYANLIYQINMGEAHKLSSGASFNFDNYEETLYSSQLDSFPRQEYVPGLFTEYTLNIDDKLTAMAGIRLDYNSVFGTFVTPRVHLKYNVNEHIRLRLSAGKGYRSPNVLAENNFILASNRAIHIAPMLRMEEAWNYGISMQNYVHLFERELSVTAEWYYTNFEEQVVLDMDSNPNAISFSNLNGRSYSSSAQIEASMEIIKGMTMTIAHRENDVETTINGNLREKALTSRSKSLITASYQSPLKKWQIDFTAQFNGGGRLPDPNPTSTVAWEKEFAPYSILNAQVTKYFRTWSLYLGSENLTGFVQKNPIIDAANPFGPNFDASMVWGPTYGRKFYIGFRWALDRDVSN